MTLVTMKEFAEMHGVSKPAVTKWKAAGRLVLVDGMVDVKASNELLKKYQRGGAARVEKLTKTVNQEKKTKSVNQDDLVNQDDSVDEIARRVILETGANMPIDEAKRVKENYLALLGQLEYDKESGLVVLVSEVADAVAAEYAKVRTRLLAIPSEQAPRIHRLKTVTEVQDVLQEIITEALEELTKDGGT